MAKDDLRIAFLGEGAIDGENPWSQGSALVRKALADHVGQVTDLPRSWGASEPLRKALLSTPLPIGPSLKWRTHFALAQIMSKSIREELATRHYDVLFGVGSLPALAGAQAPDSMVRAFTADTTQRIFNTSAMGRNPHAPLFKLPFLDGWTAKQETKTLQSQDVVLWPSGWVQEAAKETYQLKAERSFLVPWGGEGEGSGTDPDAIPAKVVSFYTPVNLLWVGNDWAAKGGPMAFDTLVALRARNVDAHLTVIGCLPPPSDVNNWVTVHPQLDRSIPEENHAIQAAFQTAHFLVQPSIEAYGFVFCEASGFGLPSICFKVCGVPIRTGVNGAALPLNSGPEDFANCILSYLNSPGAYAALRRGARREFVEKLNWKTWGQSVQEILSQALENKRRVNA